MLAICTLGVGPRRAKGGGLWRGKTEANARPRSSKYRVSERALHRARAAHRSENSIRRGVKKPTSGCGRMGEGLLLALARGKAYLREGWQKQIRYTAGYMQQLGRRVVVQPYGGRVVGVFFFLVPATTTTTTGRKVQSSDTILPRSGTAAGFDVLLFFNHRRKQNMYLFGGE